MNFEKFVSEYQLKHPKPKSPRWGGFLLRPEIIFLLLGALGSMLLSASRTFEIMREQSGLFVAIVTVAAMEFTITGLIIVFARSTGHIRWIEIMRRVSSWAAIILLVLVLIVTNTTYEIRTVGLVVNEQVINILIVLFLGALVPVMVVLNFENLSVQLPRYWREFQQAQEAYQEKRAYWMAQMDEAWHQALLESTHIESEVEYRPRAERLRVIRQLIGLGSKLDRNKLARQFKVAPETIDDDVKIVKKELSLQEDQSSSSF